MAYEPASCVSHESWGGGCGIWWLCLVVLDMLCMHLCYFTIDVEKGFVFEYNKILAFVFLLQGSILTRQDSSFRN